MLTYSVLRYLSKIHHITRSFHVTTSQHIRRRPPSIKHGLFHDSGHNAMDDEKSILKQIDELDILRSNNKSQHTSSSVLEDWKRVLVIGGQGGDGSVSISSTAQTEFAGPDGGNGGTGGHILFRASKAINKLNNLRNVIKGQNGESGADKQLDGRSGVDLYIDVPIGTVFRGCPTSIEISEIHNNREQSKNSEIVAELNNEGDIFLAARGGAGGQGNVSFKSSTNQCPTVAERGGVGEMFYIEVEMRTIADVGLVGFPNAGKSTLLRALSRAAPKVAAYPFTTLKPHVGYAYVDDETRISIADIPGLIEGAHQNKGLGIGFLKHIERCVCLVYVIDMFHGDHNTIEGNWSPVDQLKILKSELKHYNSELLMRPSAVIFNKMDKLLKNDDVMNDSKVLDSIKKCREEIGETDRVFFVSGKYGLNLSPLLKFLSVVKSQDKEKVEREFERQKANSEVMMKDFFENRHKMTQL